MRISTRSLYLPLGFILLAGCPGQREAADPRDLLGEDLSHQGVSGVEGTGRHDGVDPESDPLEELATRDECRQAHQHLARLGQAEAAAQEPDPAKAAKLRDEKILQTPEAKRFIEAEVDQCLDNETSKRLIRCILGMKKPAELDACIGR